jgi:hypothetical protein
MARDRPREAAAKFRESFEMKPDEDVCERAASLFLQSGHEPLAVEVVEQGLEAFPHSERLARLLERARAGG